MKPKYADVIIRPDGTTEFLHDDALLPLTRALGTTAETRRASHVEPFAEMHALQRARLVVDYHDAHRELSTVEARRAISNCWFADLAPISGPVLGPFNTRQEALDAEVAWIRKHHFGIPDNDRSNDGAAPAAHDSTESSHDHSAAEDV